MGIRHYIFSIKAVYPGSSGHDATIAVKDVGKRLKEHVATSVDDWQLVVGKANCRI